MKHQHDGPFWRSPVRQQSEIRVPCFLIGGFADGYRDSIPNMLQNLTKVPVKACIGPWSHSFTNDADFGPRVEWRDQAVRWWEYWLKDRDTGVMNDPKLIVFMRQWHPPNPNLESVPGEWRVEPGWPIPEAKDSTLYLPPNHTLSNSVPAHDIHKLKYVPSIGVEAGFWRVELLADQRPVDAFSLVYNSAPLGREVGILGRPHVRLQASTPVPLADWFARLCDVAPDGSVTKLLELGSTAHSETRPLNRGTWSPAKSIRWIFGYTDASDIMGFPQGASHPRGDFERAVAHDLAHALSDDYVTDPRRSHGFAFDLANGSAEGRQRGVFFSAATF
jgi:uncharacterized protein